MLPNAFGIHQEHPFFVESSRNVRPVAKSALRPELRVRTPRGAASTTARFFDAWTTVPIPSPGYWSFPGVSSSGARASTNCSEAPLWHPDN